MGNVLGTGRSFRVVVRFRYSASHPTSLALAKSAGIDVSTFDFSTNVDAAGQLVDLLGGTSFSPSGRSTSGLFNEVDPLIDLRFTALFGFAPSGVR